MAAIKGIRKYVSVHIAVSTFSKSHTVHLHTEHGTVRSVILYQHN